MFFLYVRFDTKSIHHTKFAASASDSACEKAGGNATTNKSISPGED